jgi:hypothetical protein
VSAASGWPIFSHSASLNDWMPLFIIRLVESKAARFSVQEFVGGFESLYYFRYSRISCEEITALIEPSISVNNAKGCGGALKLRRTQSVRIMLDGLAEIGQRPFLRPFPGAFRRTLALRGPAGNT